MKSRRLLLLIICSFAAVLGRVDFSNIDQAFVDSLIRYEIIEPQLGRTTIDHKNTAEQKKRTLSFRLGGEKLILALYLNSNLFSANYFERSITEDGRIVSKKNSHHCFYHGHVLGNEEDSMAAISTCDGISGYFTMGNVTYLIQPIKSVIGEVFHLVFQADHLNGPKYKCGHTRSHETHEVLQQMNDIPHKTHRIRRDVLSETKYLEMVIVNDRSQFNLYKDKTAMRTKQIANIVDSVYRVHKIRIVLIMIEIWEKQDKITVVSDEQQTLDNFEAYKRDILDKNSNTKNDNAQLLTQVSFTGGAVGKASTLSLCSRTSTGVVNDHSTNAYLTASTMAHELGHNFGFKHDKDYPDVNCECGNQNGCLMAAHLGSIPLLKLSTCSIDELKKTLLNNYGTCLFDLPIKHARDPECGNAFLEEGETCDCGPKEHCDLIGNTCCNYTTCHLYPESECSEGPCCENCKFKRKGTLCRDKVNGCDLPEYCDGKNQLCPLDSYVHNGRPCQDKNSASSLCFIGVCHTHTSQCKTLWGPGSSNADVNCYKVLNVLGKSYGHCKKLSDGSFLKCAKKDVQCGRLQCKDVPDSRIPIIGANRKGQKTSVGNFVCWGADVYMGDDIPEPGLVQDGTVCGDNKVCSNNTCIDVNEAYPQPNCPKNCSSNGICNNHGHCHCNNGFKPPDCKETCNGIGGSVDSGIGYDCFDPNATTSTAISPSTFLPTILSTSLFIRASTAITRHTPHTPMTSVTKDPNATSISISTPTPAFTTITPSATSMFNNASVYITSKPDTEATNEPTKAGTTAQSEAPTTNGNREEETTPNVKGTTPKQGDSDKSSGRAVVIAIGIIIPLILIILAILLVYHFREQIRTKLTNTRQPPQKPFTTVIYTDHDHRRASTSSREILTDAPRPRPSKLQIGGPVRNEIVITPDRNQATPSGKIDTRPLAPISRAGSSRTPPTRPKLPSPGNRCSSLPDLLDAQPSVKRPPPPASKSKSFNAVDKPTRPTPPAARQGSNKGTRPEMKPKRPPVMLSEKPKTSSNSESNRKGPEHSPTVGGNRASAEPTFRPSDLKAGKSPFGPKKA